MDDQVDSQDQYIFNRIGKVPLKWYDDQKVCGYDINLKPIPNIKREQLIQSFLKKQQNQDWWKIVYDQINQTNMKLTNQQLQLIQRIRNGKMASKSIAMSNAYYEEEFLDPFPISNLPKQKKNFMPSKWQRAKVKKILTGIQNGTIKIQKQKDKQQEQQITNPWQTQQYVLPNLPPSISAPKLKLPQTYQSYNPSQQFLFNEKQKKQWLQMDQQDRLINFIPKKYQNTRSIQFYQGLIKQRFDRCLDLYLCPRVRKKRLNPLHQSFTIKTMKPQQMRPFPTTVNIIYQGHAHRIRAINCSGNSQYIITGDQSGLLRIHDIKTTRKVFTYNFTQCIYSIDTNQNKILVGSGNKCYLLNYKIPFNKFKQVNQILQKSMQKYQDKTQQLVKWKWLEHQIIKIQIQFQYLVTHVNFHSRGDYFLTVCPQNQKKSQITIVSCISKGTSTKPFSKCKGIIQKVYFHNTKPFLIILTRKSCFIFHLQKQQIIKKLYTTGQWNSSLDIHPYGNDLVIGTYDNKINWFDLQAGDKPFKILKFHQKPIRKVRFHKKYPLFATCSDDSTICIFHAKVFKNELQNPIITPIKILKGHKIINDLGVLDIQFHPHQPWLFSIGVDNKIILWT